MAERAGTKVIVIPFVGGEVAMLILLLVGPLAAYLAGRGLISDRIEIEQGTRMGRRSILRVSLAPEPEISGAGTIVMRGTLTL